jgi:hypothetical protein
MLSAQGKLETAFTSSFCQLETLVYIGEREVVR